MGQARWHKQWPAQRPRHVWVRPGREPSSQPRQGLLLRWERDRASSRWMAVIITVEAEVLSVDVVPAGDVAPVESDPNRVLSRDVALLRGLRRAR